jgi:hypothetical protein
LPDVVSNTSPLQYLFQLDALDILHSLAGEVLIPSAVLEELSAGRRRGEPLPDPSLLSWISVRDPKALHPSLVGKRLGPGERDAISLATELVNPLVVLDDAFARRLALQLGVRVMGTLRVLLDAKPAGLVSAVEPLVTRLQSLGFYLDPQTRAAILELAGENR